MNDQTIQAPREDAEIVEMLCQRSEEGLALVERQYSRLCYRIAFNLLGRREDAEECVNDVYLAVWNTIPPQRPASLAAYVGKVTRNVAISCLRRREAAKRSCGGTVLLDELAECLPDPDTTDGAEDVELRDALEHFLATLSPDERTAMIRRYYHGDAVELIARDLGMRSGTLRVRLHRLRERLKAYLLSRGISV